MLIGNGWAFIHIPKCGGTTVRRCLFGREVSDWNPCDTADHRFHWLAAKRPEGRVCAVVRHPATWLRSYWGHRMRHGWRPRMLLDQFQSPNLTDFLLTVADEAPGVVGAMFADYVDAFDDVKVFRLPELGKALAYLGAPDMPLRANRGQDLPDIVPAALRAVCEAESATIERFGL